MSGTLASRAPRIPELYERQPRCRICRDVNRVGYVDAQLARGISATSISKMMEEMNLPTSTQMILSHQKHYVPPAAPATVTNKEDLAVLIRDRTLQAVKQGKLEPTIAHGLQAQKILDDRVNKTSDRDFIVQMARLLSGADAPAGFLPPPELVVIEGHAEEVIEE